MNLRQLETFIAVAEEASFSRAADRLHVVQSAVSAGIRALEADLGASLFDRGPRGAELSDAGHALLPEARATLIAAGAARDAVRDVRAGIRGTVSLGIMQAQRAPAPNVAEILRSFRDTHPEVEVRVRHGGGSRELVDAVRAGTLDLGFASLLGYPDGIDATLLSQETIAVACHTEHPFVDGGTVELSALTGESVADLPPPWGVRIANDLAFGAAGVPRRIAYEINDVSTLIEFVRTGLAVALLPASLLGDADGIVTVPLRRHAPLFEVSIVTPAGRRLSAATAALRDHVIASATAA
jgi:DNA-binding transcriptional LysR family regulator